MSQYVVIVKSEDKIKIAQPGRENGVPSGAGIKILDFLKSNSMTMFKRLLKEVTPYPREHMIQAMRSLSWEYNMGYHVLTQVIDGQRTKVMYDPTARNDAMVDYVYIIDLDEMTFMVRKGAEADYHLHHLPTGVEFLEDCGDSFY
jgi:hypothetical protein